MDSFSTRAHFTARVFEKTGLTIGLDSLSTELGKVNLHTGNTE